VQRWHADTGAARTNARAANAGTARSHAERLPRRLAEGMPGTLPAEPCVCVRGMQQGMRFAVQRWHANTGAARTHARAANAGTARAHAANPKWQLCRRFSAMRR